METDINNIITNPNDKWVYPFANLEVGDVFLYGFAPFIKVGKIRGKGAKYTEINYDANAVSLINGTCIMFNKSEKVFLIENPWKDYKAPHLPKGYYNDN